METTAPTRDEFADKPAAPRLPVGLITCALAVTVLGLLGYALATQGDGRAMPPMSGEVAAASGHAMAAAAPAPWETAIPRADAETLEAWAHPTDLQPPTFEAPYHPPAIAGPKLTTDYELPPITAGELSDEASNPIKEEALAPPSKLVAEASPPALDAEDPAPLHQATDDQATDTLIIAAPAPAEVIVETPTAMATPSPPAELFAAPGLALPPATRVASTAPSEEFLTLGDAEAGLAGSAPIEELLLDTPEPSVVAKLLTKEVQAAFTLGRHGALYAARSRFIDVLRQVAIANDAATGADAHSHALAAGLRALDEAVAFEPRGDALETDLDVAAIAASHKTPLYRDLADRSGAARTVLPSEAIARYQRYAQHKLAAAVRGNQAGSMALHGLGKTYARLHELGEAELAERASLTMYRAAVEAHPGNYLAANELGVGLAKVGRYQAARRALERAIAEGGNSTVYRNLAVVQQNLGQPQLAAAAGARAEQLAMRERSAGVFSRERGVDWVNPQQFRRVADATNRNTGRPSQTATTAMPPQGPQYPQQAVPAPRDDKPSLASRLMPWKRSRKPSGIQPAAAAVQPQPTGYTPGNRTAAPVRSQTILR